VVSLKQTNTSEVGTASIIMAMMGAVHTSETLAYFNKSAWYYIPEGCDLHTCNHKDLKSHILKKLTHDIVHDATD
jgi:hypothetical protein